MSWGRASTSFTLPPSSNRSSKISSAAGKSSASTIRHAYILLHANKPDTEVAELVRCHPLSVFKTRQCLKRRIPTIEALKAETKTWNRQRNQAQKGVDWQFTAEDARVKLKWLYPQILEI